MKKIEAMIRPEKLTFVKDALKEAGYSGLTVTEVKGRGQQEGITLTWRVGEYVVDLIDKIKLEVFIPETEVKKVIEIIIKHARTGEVGDGKIFVLPCEEVIRIRTGENGKKII